MSKARRCRRPTQVRLTNLLGVRLNEWLGITSGAHMKLTPLKQRIVDALKAAPRQRVSYHDLAAHLWPHEKYPRAWRYSSNGGPHGWAMPLGRALRELREAGIAQELRHAGGGAGHGVVVLL